MKYILYNPDTNRLINKGNGFATREEANHWGHTMAHGNWEITTDLAWAKAHKKVHKKNG